jgi:hypothetical protein
LRRAITIHPPALASHRTAHWRRKASSPATTRRLGPAGSAAARAHANGFVADVVQVAPDTQTALALVSAEVGCHLTLASVAENVADPHVVFIPLNESTPSLDVHLRAAWRRADQNPALRAVLDELLTLNDGVAG